MKLFSLFFFTLLNFSYLEFILWKWVDTTTFPLGKIQGILYCFEGYGRRMTRDMYICGISEYYEQLLSVGEANCSLPKVTV
jgi:hypothetical protein